ncbi:hypothetical protein PYW07_003781 [Mythimna separata]|uniref:C-type lectin domain-containing protein n=1 Tax=Mythimna separata TaxID=271217 RepID=A0AAD7YMU6_MYTSE|nr:hypothetical protein PYW07_003781 [Mythimna separata]
MFSKTLLLFLVVDVVWSEEPNSYVQTDVRSDKFFRNDYSYIETEKSFYKYHISGQTWADAKRTCVQEGAILWYPDNDDEMHAVISLWNTTLPACVHVGMSDFMMNGQFETVEGKLISDVYNKWEPGQPNNYGGSQHCIRFCKSDNVVDDGECGMRYNFICKKSLQSLKWNNDCNVSDPDYTLNEDNGKCYKVHTTPLSWFDAYATCRRAKSHLAVISDQSANQLLDYLVNLTESTLKPRVKENYQSGIYHVGFHNRFIEGWQTVKGTPMNVDAENWLDGYKPADDRAQCGSMFYTGRLINTDCDMKCFFICEHERS